jgi:hypothetical protein
MIQCTGPNRIRAAYSSERCGSVRASRIEERGTMLRVALQCAPLPQIARPRARARCGRHAGFPTRSNELRGLAVSSRAGVGAQLAPQERSVDREPALQHRARAERRAMPIPATPRTLKPPPKGESADRYCRRRLRRRTRSGRPQSPSQGPVTEVRDGCIDVLASTAIARAPLRPPVRRGDLSGVFRRHRLRSKAPARARYRNSASYIRGSLGVARRVGDGLSVGSSSAGVHVASRSAALAIVSISRVSRRSGRTEPSDRPHHSRGLSMSSSSHGGSRTSPALPGHCGARHCDTGGSPRCASCSSPG